MVFARGHQRRRFRPLRKNPPSMTAFPVNAFVTIGTSLVPNSSPRTWGMVRAERAGADQLNAAHVRLLMEVLAQ